MAAISAILYFLSHHSLISIPIVVIAAAIVGHGISNITNNPRWIALAGVGFFASILNVFFGSSLNAAFIANFGTYGTAVITQAEQTNSQLNDQYMWQYYAVMRTENGRDVKTEFDTMSASIYPLRNAIEIPPQGARFVVKYIPGFERNIVILRDESAFGKRLLLRDALRPVEQAKAQLAASPANAAFRVEYRDALRQFLNKYEKDLSADQATAYRNELNRLD